MKIPTFDVAIVGASVSGATLASHLGRGGLEVALIDRDRFPRRKACGEGISEIALEALCRAGAGDALAKLPGRPFYHYRIDLGTRSWEFASARERRLKGVGIERFELDRLLVEHASSFPSVSTLLGSGVVRIDSSPGGHLLRFADGDRIRASRLVLADGANSQNAKRLGIPKRTTGAPLWGISFLLEGRFERRSDEVLVLLRKGFEINCTPVGERRLNLAILAEKGHVRGLQDPDLRRRLLAEASEKCSFRGEPVDDPIQVGPVGSSKRPYAHGPVLLVGDTAESLDPIAGMGMTHGILTAELAAEAILAEHRHEISAEATGETYARAAERMARPYRGFTHLTASLLRHPLRKVLIPALSYATLPGTFRGALGCQTCRRPAFSTLPLMLLSFLGA